MSWTHNTLHKPYSVILLPDGMHLNEHGQSLLHESYRKAILKSLTKEHNHLSNGCLPPL